MPMAVALSCAPEPSTLTMVVEKRHPRGQRASTSTHCPPSPCAVPSGSLLLPRSSAAVAGTLIGWWVGFSRPSTRAAHSMGASPRQLGAGSVGNRRRKDADETGRNLGGASAPGGGQPTSSGLWVHVQMSKGGMRQRSETELK